MSEICTFRVDGETICGCTEYVINDRCNEHCNIFCRCGSPASHSCDDEFKACSAPLCDGEHCRQAHVADKHSIWFHTKNKI